MIYLSKLEVKDPTHSKVMLGFPNSNDQSIRSQWGILWRSEPGYILVQSQLQPDWSSTVKNFYVKQFEFPAYELEQRMIFKLAIAPLIMMRSAAAKNAFRVTTAQEWLDARVERLGAKFEVFESTTWIALDKSNNHKVRIPAETVTGVLTVNDPEKLKNAVINGIGRGKSYGCGLLTVK